MSDPDTTDAMVTVAKHAGSGGIGAILISLLNKWRADKREEKLETILNAQNVQLALMGQTLNDLGNKLDKHEDVFKDVVKNQLMIDALHRRVDALEKKKSR